MSGYRVPLVPLVTIRATYDCAYWPDECGRCGVEAETLAPCEDAPDGYVCPSCGPLPANDVNPSEDPAQWGGWCDPCNPWGTLYGDDEYRADDETDSYGRNGPPVEITLPVGEAARFLADFPGGVWDLCEGESSANLSTGVDVSVTAHVDGPGAVAALTLAGETLAGRR